MAGHPVDRIEPLKALKERAEQEVALERAN